MDEQFQFHFDESSEGFIRQLSQLAGWEDLVAAGLTNATGTLLDADGDTPMCLDCNRDTGAPMCFGHAFIQLSVLLDQIKVIKQNLQARLLENFVRKGNADWQNYNKLRDSFDGILEAHTI